MPHEQRERTAEAVLFHGSADNFYACNVRECQRAITGTPTRLQIPHSVRDDNPEEKRRTQKDAQARIPPSGMPHEPAFT